MKISRLLEIVYILLDKRMVTAKELADHFEVSTRTIYRDVDVLSAAGIPIYTNKGTGGGIGILDNFILNKSLLSENEQSEIIASLQAFKALNVENINPVLSKLAVIFNKSNVDWIDVDFSYWGSPEYEKIKFTSLKEAILKKQIISFDYFNSYGEASKREIEPLKILFKGQSWYIYGFCKLKSDYRIFKITRIKNLILKDEFFNRLIIEGTRPIITETEEKLINLLLEIDSTMSYRVYDEFSQENIEKTEDGNFIVKIAFPKSPWLYGYLLSYGDSLKVIEPEDIKDIIKTKLQRMVKKYSI